MDCYFIKEKVIYMKRFFIKNEDMEGSHAYISGKDAHHILNVLRLSRGEKIIISNGTNEFLTVIEELSSNKIKLKILENINTNSESSINITLFQGLPKADKMELIIQKCTELGVKAFIPVSTKYSVVNIDERNREKKIYRWQKISHEASKQSGRVIVPDVYMPVTFKEALERIKEYDLCLILYEKEKNTGIKDILMGLDDVKNIAIFIGPEGGFSEEEIRLALEYGAKSVTLGPRILRTETAGIVASSIIMYELGDIGVGGFR